MTTKNKYFLQDRQRLLGVCKLFFRLPCRDGMQLYRINSLTVSSLCNHGTQQHCPNGMHLPTLSVCFTGYKGYKGLSLQEGYDNKQKKILFTVMVTRKTSPNAQCNLKVDYLQLQSEIQGTQALQNYTDEQKHQHTTYLVFV